MSTRHNSKALSDGIDEFTSCRILVVGDVIMDEFLWGRVERISPEAPVPVVEVERESLILGGAGNVVNNIISLGGRVVLCGVPVVIVNNLKLDIFECHRYTRTVMEVRRSDGGTPGRPIVMSIMVANVFPPTARAVNDTDLE